MINDIALKNIINIIESEAANNRRTKHTLYGKTVPASVREFISMKSESYTVTSKMNKSEKTT